LLDEGCVGVVKGKVTSISTALNEADFDQVIDLDQATVFPGFIDLHIHGAVGVDTMTAGKDDLVRVSQFLAANGVTSWLPTLVPAAASDYQKAVSAIETLMIEQANQQVPDGARVLGVHYEGPFVSSAQCGALHPAHFKTFSSLADIESLPVPAAEGAVLMMTLAPEVEGAIDLTRELVSRGWIVSVGHTRAGVEELEQAFEMGARHMTHFMNAMPPLHHRAPGPVGWGLTKSEATFDVIADGIHLDPLVLKLLLHVKGSERMMLISDAIAAAGAGDGDYEIWGETISVKNGRTSNAKGSIAGSVITMLDALRMMRLLGVSEADVAKMTSANPARLLGLERDIGSIEAGKSADLMALDQQGNVRFTMVKGRELS
jgi:N-acetylglucosamine-6-phosphate deacetylase